MFNVNILFVCFILVIANSYCKQCGCSFRVTAILEYIESVLPPWCSVTSTHCMPSKTHQKNVTDISVVHEFSSLELTEKTCESLRAKARNGMEWLTRKFFNDRALSNAMQGALNNVVTSKYAAQGNF